MSKFPVLLTVSLAMAGCASSKYNYSANVTVISEPPLGTTQASHVGDVILRQGKYRENEAIFLPVKADISWAYDLLMGYYLKHGEDESAEYYSPAGGEDGGKVDKAVLADSWKRVMAKKNTKTLCVVTVFNATSCADNMNFERVKKPISGSQ